MCCFAPAIALLAALLPVLGQEPPPVLTSAEAVRQAARGSDGEERMARLRGVVVYSAPNGQPFFVQDETGGVCVSGSRDKALKNELRPGAVVEVEGMALAGRIVAKNAPGKREPIRVNFVAEGELPRAVEATVAQLAERRFQGVLVEVSGIIRSIRAEAYGASIQDTLVLVLADGHSRLILSMPGWRGQGGLPQHLVGAGVKVRGVFNGTPLDRQPAFGHRLFISSLKEIRIERPATPLFGGPLYEIGPLREALLHEPKPERLHLRGRVTVPIPGKGMYVQDETGAIWVDAAPVPETGETVELAGFGVWRDGAPVIEDGTWRETEPSIAVGAPLITAEAALSGAMDGQLVQMEALLLTESSASEGSTLVFQSGDRVFLARFGNPRMRPASFGEGGWLRLTGVCVNTYAPPFREPGLGRPASFHLLLAGPEAIAISGTPGWWTVRRIVTVVAVLAALALAAAVWATTLRQRVEQQTEQIREHLAREAVAQERLRIARELHDSVQQDLLGITMQLKATHRLLESEPERARNALTLASAMVRRSQAETHRAVWDLRERAAEHTDLVPALEEMVAGLTTDESPRVEVICSGERRALPAAIESQVLRVAQEAVTNALKHGRASRIAIEVDFSQEKLSVTVRDNGRGFDADHPPAAHSGHFGLFGMRERAIKLHADLRVTSKPGAGTAVHLDVPLPSDFSEYETLRTPSALRLIPRPSTS
jgi:signal transduction histidine kinase